MKKMFAAVIMAVGFFVFVSNPTRADHKGWYVIMGSFHYTATSEANRRADIIRSNCGIDPYVEDALNVSGLNPNVLFVYLGPYHAKSQANRIKNVARGCVGDAYIKYGVPN